jgi:hypothetical protein
MNYSERTALLRWGGSAVAPVAQMPQQLVELIW